MLEWTKKTNSAATAFLVAGAFWMLYGALNGALTAIHLVSPEFFNNMAFFVFGRTRPVHVNTVVFGFVSQMLWGCALYIGPALLKRSLWSERLGWASFVLYNLAVVSGPITFPLGITQAREYAEYIWIADVSLVLSLLVLIFDLVMTIATRRERMLYVSVWYFIGAAIWTAGVYPLGNVMWDYPQGAMPGLIDSIFLWFYGHNLVGLLLTPLAVGVAYYIVPRITRTPLFSHTISLIGFWALIVLYTHIGGHHLLQAPIPNWLKVISVVDSMMMFIPVAAVLANIWLTARGKGGLLLRDPAGRWVLVGTVWYLFTCIQGPLQSLPSVQTVVHFTNWTIGHAHIAVLGFAGFIALGGLWYVLPHVSGRQVYSQRLVNLQFGLVSVGLVGFFVVLTIAGLIQGESWRNGETVYRVLPMLAPYMAMRALLGVFIIAGAAVGLVNVVLTLTRGQPVPAAAAGGLDQ